MTLAEIRDMETLVPELQLDYPQGAVPADGGDLDEDAEAGMDRIDHTDTEDDEGPVSVQATAQP